MYVLRQYTQQTFIIGTHLEHILFGLQRHPQVSYVELTFLPCRLLTYMRCVIHNKTMYINGLARSISRLSMRKKSK